MAAGETPAGDLNTNRLREALNRLESLVGSGKRAPTNVRDSVAHEGPVDESSTTSIEQSAPSPHVAALEERLAHERRRADEAEARAGHLLQRAEAAERELDEVRSISAQQRAVTQSAAAELRAEIRRLKKERDRLLARLERQEQRIERAGLQIQWGDDFISPVDSRS